jgi:hypothetical protein
MSRRQAILAVALAALGALPRPVSSGTRELLVERATATPDRLRAALTILANVPSGKDLLERAERLARATGGSAASAADLFRWSAVSRTDAVLTRTFSPETGRESRERRVTIYLRHGQKLEDLVLDVAHELTHATSGPAWDPYDPELTAGKYIWAAIEGEGGEIAALVAECRVALELASRYEVSASRCDRYRGAALGEGVDPERVRRDFYRVGKWRTELVRSLGHETRRFPLLSAEAPKLYSSTGHAPYPVALLREFEKITETACANSRRRSRSLSDRSPASESTARFLARRCEHDQ